MKKAILLAAMLPLSANAAGIGIYGADHEVTCVSGCAGTLLDEADTNASAILTARSGGDVFAGAEVIFPFGGAPGAGVQAGYRFSRLAVSASVGAMLSRAEHTFSVPGYGDDQQRSSDTPQYIRGEMSYRGFFAGYMAYTASHDFSVRYLAGPVGSDDWRTLSHGAEFDVESVFAGYRLTF